MKDRNTDAIEVPEEKSGALLKVLVALSANEHLYKTPNTQLCTLQTNTNAMKQWLLIILVIPFWAIAQRRVDIIINNARIVDGTGNPWYRGSIAIKKGKIVKVGSTGSMKAKTTIDANNEIVAPGFVDVHTHIEGDEVKNPTADNFIYDGVTTVVTGNCGESKVAIADYFQLLGATNLAVNVATLIGHNDVRQSVMGTANRAPTPQEQAQMEQLVALAMQQGAVGLSTGLIYIPGTYAATAEIVDLAKQAARYNGVYATHMRTEGDSVLVAIAEALQIGREANIPVEISHFKVSGQQNWGRSKETIAAIEAARKEGVEVTIDQYPYTASSTSLSTLLPETILADGSDSIKARLQRPHVKAFVISEMLRSLQRRQLNHFSYAVVANFEADTTMNGKSIEQVNLVKGHAHTAAAEAETVIEMMLQGGAGMVFHGMSEEDVERIMKYPFNMFASDASIRVYRQGVPHPRGYGTNARVLAKYVRERNLMPLEEAVRRMTSLPAQKFNLQNRGLLLEGKAADIVIFNEQTVQDNSTFEDPHQYSTGFSYVLVNGEVIVEKGKHRGIRNGQLLYGPGKL